MKEMQTLVLEGTQYEIVDGKLREEVKDLSQNIYYTKKYSGTDDEKLQSAIEAAQNSQIPATIVINGPLFIEKNHYLNGSVPIKIISDKASYYSYSGQVKKAPDNFFDIIIKKDNVTVFNFGIDEVTKYKHSNNKQTSFYLEGLKVKSASPNTSTDWRSRDWKNTYLLQAIHSHINCRDILCYGMGGVCNLQRFEDAINTPNYCDYCSFENISVQLVQGVAIGSRSNDNGIYRNISVDYPPLSNTSIALIEIRHDRGSVIDNIVCCGGYAEDFDTTPREQPVIRFFNCFTKMGTFEEEFTLSKYAIECVENANVDIGIINLRKGGGGAVKCANSLVTVNSITIDEEKQLSGMVSVVNASPNGHFTLTGYVRCPDNVPLYNYTDGAIYNIAQNLMLSVSFEKTTNTIKLTDYLSLAVNLFETIAFNKGIAIFENFKGGYLIGATMQGKRLGESDKEPISIPRISIREGKILTIQLNDDEIPEYYFLNITYIPKFIKG